MKKLAYVLVVMFVAALGTTTYANSVVIDNQESIVVVDLDLDKKPCPADCKGECCKDKKAECDKSKAETKDAKACDKSAKKCCGSKSAAKTDDKKTETADKK